MWYNVLANSNIWIQSEGVIIMGAIFLALVIGYYKTKEIREVRRSDEHREEESHGV